jgi:hypothetical protein
MGATTRTVPVHASPAPGPFRQGGLQSQIPVGKHDLPNQAGIAAARGAKLPRPDGPDFAFDGTRLTYPGQVIDELSKAERAKEPGERPVEIELRPVPSVADNEEVAA